MKVDICNVSAKELNQLCQEPGATAYFVLVAECPSEDCINNPPSIHLSKDCINDPPSICLSEACINDPLSICLPISPTACTSKLTPEHPSGLSEPSLLDGIPPEYHKFSDVFSKDKVSTLALHRPYNLEIHLEEGAKP